MGGFHSVLPSFTISLCACQDNGLSHTGTTLASSSKYDLVTREVLRQGEI